ncbi:MAG TPA: bacteriohemerythrin, partial [Syntrophales bacterium]|nr:bacteriohemerythrin [Syntrophales bacterium]
LEGDGRTMPNHFDPQVLDAFRRVMSIFEEIYQKYIDLSLEDSGIEQKYEFQWADDLASGFEAIDTQHKELITLTRKLIDAVGKKDSLREAGLAMDFLREYVVEHFQMEDLYMETYGYPERAAHKERHHQFIEEFEAYQKRFYQGIADHRVTLEIKGWLYNWLLKHITISDKDLGNFLKQKTSGNA